MLTVFFPKAGYFTILRDPVTRVVSSYCYSLNNPNDLAHRLIKENNLGLADFARLLNNVQTRSLGKHVPTDSYWGLLRRKLGLFSSWIALAEAKRTLDRCAIVGVLEEFPKVLRLLEARFGWENIANRFKNVSGSEKLYQTLDDRTRKIIEAENQCDIALYRYARERFLRQCREYGMK